MYQITKADELAGYTDNPEFCYLLPSGSPQVVRLKDKDQATGIIYQGVIYNLPGHNDFKGAETAMAIECDAGALLTEQERQLAEERAAREAVENAMCEADIATEEWRAEIENALCELDEGV